MELHGLNLFQVEIKELELSADTFLRMNGYRLDVKTEEDIEYMKKLLFEIQEERASLNVETMAKIILYVAKRIVKL